MDECRGEYDAMVRQFPKGTRVRCTNQCLRDVPLGATGTVEGYSSWQACNALTNEEYMQHQLTVRLDSREGQAKGRVVGVFPHSVAVTG
jgi:hypothetical protein